MKVVKLLIIIINKINMPEFIYNFNSLYICVLLIMYKNYEYINIILQQLYLLNSASLIIAINIVGLYLFLKNVSFEVNLKWSIKYK